jgi:hypothetical protein
MFAASVECLLNNLLSRICLLRFFKHNKLKMSKTLFFFKCHPIFIITLVESFFYKLSNGVGFIPGPFFNSEHNPYLFLMFNFKKHRSMHCELLCNQLYRTPEILKKNLKMVRLMELVYHVLHWKCHAHL